MSAIMNNWKLFLLCAVALFASGCFLDDDDDDTAAPLATGLQTLQSGGVEREYYLQLPTDYDDATGVQATALGDDMRKPLVFAYHGYSGSYQNWVGETPYYDFLEVVGDEAIFVVPEGLPDASGKNVWGGEKDLDFFVNILAELDSRGLQYNPNKIFVAGHSNGAGFVHELGCAYGDVVRGVISAAGALTSNDCVGSTAALIFHGSNDPLTTGGLATASKRYWVLYNGWDEAAFTAAEIGPCEDYSFPGEQNSDYPVLWCLHEQGHAWPDFGSQTALDFMQGLAEVEPTPAAPFGGGAERATPPSDALLTIQIAAPPEMNRPLRAVATLRPLSYIDNPTCSAPDVVLGVFSTDGQVIAGQVSEPITFPITYLDFSGALVFPSEVTLGITIYVEGGSTAVIPSPGIDYDLSVPLALVSRDQDVIISDVATLSPVPDLCGFGG
jgi:poly(3-hydroxybutyrate) depolymerase